MGRLLLLIFILLCVGCTSRPGNNAKKENADSLTIEELLLQSAKDYMDSVTKARNYYKQNLGFILPEWEQDLKQKMQNPSLSSLPPIELVRITYSVLEHSTTVSAWNNQLKKQGHDISDSILKQDAVNDEELAKLQITTFPSIRLSFARACKEHY